MTLNSRIVIGRPVPVRPLFDFCRALIGTPADTPVEESYASYGGPSRSIGNPMDIGLPAWLTMRYGADGPLLEPPYAHPDDEAFRQTDPAMNGCSAIEISFDTGYSYRAGCATCDDLHAYLVTEVGRHLDSLGAPWKWCNEYTGEWHDQYDGLSDFGDPDKVPDNAFTSL